MQDGSTATATVDTPQQQTSNFIKPPEAKPETNDNSIGNPHEKPQLTEDDAGKPKSKFAGNDSLARQLTVAEMNNALNVEALDASKATVKDAWLKDDKQVEIELANGDRLLVGRDENGYTRISIPDGQPANAKTMVAMAEIARAKGWPEINVRGSEEFKAMSYHAITRAGLKMTNPPDAALIEAVREKFEAQLREPDLPKVTGPQNATGAAKVAKPEDEETPGKKPLRVSAPAPRMK